MTIKSKAQARFLGAIAGGAKPASGKGPTRTKALTMLRENRGTKMRNLPERAAPRMSARAPRRVSSRGRR